jgi:hypothetical protein
MRQQKILINGSQFSVLLEKKKLLNNERSIEELDHKLKQRIVGFESMVLVLKFQISSRVDGLKFKLNTSLL